ncbi:phosphate-selective porin O/P [Archangium gephyra]|uniref:FmdC n=1 Tax=Archangium gephyra TaxID=48 RepID=A0AAC8QDQ5_9BACT|nr:porin [Archangium gephyra]AKJ05857.1 FmdC precursor [Archangium gephyra]REG27387.1 phosphate-selective porin O/P [Archangium gephyra]
MRAANIHQEEGGNRKSVRAHAALVLAMTAVLVHGPARAQEPTPAQAAAPAADAPSTATTDARVAELEQQVRLLQSQREEEQKKAAEEKKKGVSVTAAPGKGLTVTTDDGRFGITVRARAQLRETLTREKDKTTNEVNVKTLRLVTQGHVLTTDLKYTIQLAFGGNDFETGSSSPIFDAFVDYTKVRDLNLRVGQYFVPFDRARTIREFALQLVDRQQVVQELTLDRDVGLMLYSNDLGGLNGLLGYHLFVGGGEGRNRFGAQATGGIYVARLVLRPWGAFDDDQEGDLQRLPKPRLALGVAGGYNQGTNRQRSTTGNALTLGTLDYRHAAADVVFKYSGFSFLGEAVLRSAGRDVLEGTNASGAAIREFSRSGWGYFLQAGLMVSPLVEVAARWDHLFAFAGTDPALVTQVNTQGRQVGGGLNVYLNGHAFKLQTDYFYIFGHDRSAGRHIARLQLDASF